MALQMGNAAMVEALVFLKNSYTSWMRFIFKNRYLTFNFQHCPHFVSLSNIRTRTILEESYEEYTDYSCFKFNGGRFC